MHGPEGSDPYAESLDDPSLPFDIRWALLTELNQTNQRFGIYREFVRGFEQFIGQTLPPNGRASLIEVGSGFGGLAFELQRWATGRSLNLDMNLYDSQAEVLEKSWEQFAPDAKPQLHVATDQHLRAFPDQAFDYLVSLQVLHHIQPFATAVDALEQMLRVARRGVFVIDLDRRPGAITFGRLWNRFTGVSPALAADGLKSQQRAFSGAAVHRALTASSTAAEFYLHVKRYLKGPFWRLQARRHREA